MAHKRKAQEAFAQPQGQLSAFAAARLAKEQRHVNEAASKANDLATEVAVLPYDGHHSRTSTPDRVLTDEDAAQSPARDTLQTFPLPSTAEDSHIVADQADSLELRLKPGEASAFLGEYDIKVLEPTGSILVAGMVLRAKDPPQRIYAPSTHAFPHIRTFGSVTTVRISSISPGMRKLEKLSPTFRHIWDSQADQGRSFGYLGTWEALSRQHSLNIYEISERTVAILGAFNSKVTNAPRKPRIMAIGPKGSGKSTFNRFLCNYVNTSYPLSKCLYLDLDPGQPEFGPPGQLSLIEVTAPVPGPPFTHSTAFPTEGFEVIRSHTLAATTFKDDPQHYKACATDLSQYINKRYPAIVNSCGWVNGLGAETLVDLVSTLAITELVVLEPVEDSLVSAMQERSSALTVYRIPRHVPRPSPRTPAESRAMQTLAYFHCRPGAGDAAPRWSGKPISRIRPWIVIYAGTNPDISAVMSYGHSPTQEFLAEVLDGSIVAISILDEGSEPSDVFLPDNASNVPGESPTDLEELIGRTPEGIPYIKPDAQGINRTLNPRLSQCIGLALIRGIDAEQKQLHLVTPLPESRIAELREKRIVLVRGSFDPPEWAYLEDLHKAGSDSAAARLGKTTRPWVTEREMVGIEGSVWRLRHPPTSASVAGPTSSR